MPYTTLQAAIYDKGLASAQVFVRLTLPTEIWLTTETAPRSPSNPGSPLSASFMKAVAAIVHVSETSLGSGVEEEGDEVQAVQVTCRNIPLPIHTQPTSRVFNSFTRGRLSDYLGQMAVCGGTPLSPYALNAPPFAQIYIAPVDLAGANQDEPTTRWYLFKGLVDSFAVTDNGETVVIRMLEDSRWNREHPYPLSQRSYLQMPQGSAGLHEPLLYGDFGLWAHRHFHTGQNPLYGPFDRSGPQFPVCMNGAVVQQSQDLRTQEAGQLSSAHTLGTMDRVAVPAAASAQIYNLNWPQGARWQAVAYPDEGGAAIVDPYLNSSAFFSFGFDGIGNPIPFPVKVDGRVDQKKGATSLLYTGHTAGIFIPPKGTVAGPSVSGTSPTMASIFNQTHLLRSLARMYDGDRYSWFRDDVSTNTTRRVLFELGSEQNRGAIVAIWATFAGRVLAGPVGDLNTRWRALIDWQYNAAAGNPVTAAWQYLGWTETSASNGVGGLYFWGKADLTGILGYAPHAESWDFRQADYPGGGRGMVLTIEWEKVGTFQTLALMEVGLQIQFDPGRQFAENRERHIETTRTGYTASGRKRKVVVGRDVMERVLTARDATPPRSMFYLGLGQAADPGNGFPGREPHPDNASFPGENWPSSWPNVLDNPADIIRHILWQKGGAERSDTQAAWPPITANEIDVSVAPNETVRSFTGRALDLDAACAEASGNVAEKFRIAVALPDWPDVRSAIRAVLVSVPGLRLIRTPQPAPGDSSEYRGTWGMSWPLTPGPSTWYRRPINPYRDVLSMQAELTPTSLVVNDLRVRYGYSTAKGAYQRESWSNQDTMEHGWPWNSTNAGGQTSDAGDSTSTLMQNIIVASWYRYGTKEKVVELPWVYRWQEALACRNWILRWYGFQRTRVLMVMKQTALDLLPGDYFEFGPDTDRWMNGAAFPQAQMPMVTGGDEKLWAGKCFYVERVGYRIEAGGVVAVVQAINCDKQGEI